MLDFLIGCQYNKVYGRYNKTAWKGNNSMETLFQKIDYYKKVLDEKAPLTHEDLNSLRAYYKLNLTYSSNALEGNTLNLSETKIAIEDGLTVSGKPLKDYYEAVGHAEAFDLMYSLAQGHGNVVTERNICRLHELFYLKVDPLKAGKYKTMRNYISGSEHIPVSPESVPEEMRKFEDWANKNCNKLHPVEFAALAHKNLVDIHPFEDGNGRTARLLMNLSLLNKGYLIVTIPPVLRMEYIAALEQSRRLSMKPFVKLVAECEMESYRDRFRMLEIPFPKLQAERTF